MAQTAVRHSARWHEAVSHLRRADGRWGPLLDRVGPCTLKPKRDRFGTLVRSIVSQQISTKAAKSISARLLELVGGTLNEKTLLAAGESVIRQAGVSGVKAQYILNLAASVHEGRVAIHRMGRLADETIKEQLVAVKGIGPWTAEMFLIFCLNRPDVLPVGDLGVRSSIRRHFGFEELPTPAQCLELAAPWRPFRTVASWYLWRGLDGL